MRSLSFPLMGGTWLASGSKETAHSNHRQYFGGEGGTSLPQSHISLLHLKLQLLWPWLQQHGTNTNVKQHSHALLNICINLLCRRPAQVHVLAFKCLSLSQFHSQIPKIYTFQTWYSPFSVQLLPLPWITLSPHCQCYTMPTVLSKSCSEYQNIMTQLAYEHVNDSFFID